MMIMTFKLANLFYILEDHFSNGIGLKQQHFEKSIAYIDGIDEAKFNVFLQRQLHPQPEQLISKVKDFFKQNNISSWVYVVPSTLETPLLQEALKHQGLVFDETSTAMHCELKFLQQTVIEPEHPLIIQPADVHKNEWLHVLQEAFGGTDITINQYAQALDRAKAKKVNMQHFLGMLDGKPISTITLTFLNDSVRIDNVATNLEYQKQGYGSQMVQFGLNLSHAKNFKRCFLDASSKGLSIYKNLGFEEIFTYRIYMAKI